MLLNVMRAANRDEQTYASTVLINPGAAADRACAPPWFPHSRVLTLDGDRFCWRGGAPTYHGVPSGTVLLA
jgi:hypothetical protein